MKVEVNQPPLPERPEDCRGDVGRGEDDWVLPPPRGVLGEALFRGAGVSNPPPDLPEFRFEFRFEFWLDRLVRVEGLVSGSSVGLCRP